MRFFEGGHVGGAHGTYQFLATLPDTGAHLHGLLEATGIVFRETDGDYDFDFHCAPRRQYVINLDAPVEIETGDGSTRRIGAGEILLAEDTSGRGHRSRAVDGQPRRCVFVTLD